MSLPLTTFLNSYLASSIHLVESSPELFASTLGKAGGFLTAGWFDSVFARLRLLPFRL